MAAECGFETFQPDECARAFSPPGGTPRLYGRQDARRYGKAYPSDRTRLVYAPDES